MTALTIDGVRVFANTKIFSEKELARYVEFSENKLKPQTLTEIFVKLADDGGVDITYTVEDKFERIRRITGLPV